MSLQGFSKQEIGQMIAVLARIGLSQECIVVALKLGDVKKAYECLGQAGYLRWDNIPGWQKGICRNVSASAKRVRDYLEKFDENAQQDGLTQEQGAVVQASLTAWLQKREHTTVSYRGCHAPCDRRIVVRRLYRLGIQQRMIPRITGYDDQIIRIDLLDYQQDCDESTAYGNVLVEYARCLVHLETKTTPEPGIEDVKWYLEVLERFLEKREMLAYCLGVWQTSRTLGVPQYEPAQNPYVLLYFDMIGNPACKSHANPDPRKQIRERFDHYAKQVAEGVLAPPKDKWEVSTFLLREVTDRLRDQVWPVWKQEWCDALNKMLGELSPGRSRVIRLYYGFYGPRQTIRQIAKETGYTWAWVKRLLDSAHRRMRRMEDFLFLSCEAVPLGQEDRVKQCLEKELAESLELIRQMKEDPLHQENAEPALDERARVFLSRHLNDLELSVRAHNCLYWNARLTFVYELVEKTEEQLLKIKSFGKKCLDEVKDYLAEYGLHLGMKLPEDLLEQLRTQPS